MTPVLLKTRVAKPVLGTAAELKHFVISLYDTPVVAVPAVCDRCLYIE